MIRALVCTKIQRAVDALVASGHLSSGVPFPAIEVQDTKQPEHGDLATNWAMVAYRFVSDSPQIPSPRALAELLSTELDSDASFAKVEVAGPGFINLTLSGDLLVDLVARTLTASHGSVLESHSHFARPVVPPIRINLEFVSVNPNGPITIGSGRGAAYGSTLANVLQVCGHDVHREYYINDGVNSEQMRQFAESIRSYLLVRIYGEYVESSSADLTNPSLLAAIEGFSRSRGSDLLKADENTIYREFCVFVEETTRTIETEPAYKAAQKSVAFDYYQRDRPSQLKRFLKETWKTGEFKSAAADYTLYYKGDYVFDVVQKLVNTDPGGGSDNLREFEDIVWNPELLNAFQKRCEQQMTSGQKQNLAAFGVTFDTWFSEQSLHDTGLVTKHIDALVAAGVADEEPVRTKLKMGKGGVIEEVVREPQNEAMELDDVEVGSVTRPELSAPTLPEGSSSKTLWLRSTLFGDDMDRVLRRQDGRLTYIASDVAYHADKFNRPAGADKLITVLGPDHHGYINRLHAVVAAEFLAEGDPATAPKSDVNIEVIWKSEQERDLFQSDFSLRDQCNEARRRSDEKLEVLIFQLVRFMKDGSPAPMRKRDGNIYALIDLINEVGAKVKPNGTVEEKQLAGKDVARFFYLMRHHDTTFDFDLDLAAKQSDENPVFYVQYAHARVCSVLEKAKSSGFDSVLGTPLTKFPKAHAKERALILKIADLSYEIERCSVDYAVSRLTTYAIELARTYHGFYDACRVIDMSDPTTTQWRLQICLATQAALKATLDVLGVSAPTRMERDSISTSEMS